MEGSIFISYRRGDGPGFAGRLYDRLEQEFSPERVFLDVDNIAPGLDFVEVLHDKVAACDVLLAVIGRGWAEARDGNGELRLHNPDDFVRIEIEQALSQGKRVIPVLVDGAEMPARKAVPESLHPLLRRNAVRLTHEGFRSDVERLVKALEEALSDLREVPKPRLAPEAGKEESPREGDVSSRATGAETAAGSSFEDLKQETLRLKDTSKMIRFLHTRTEGNQRVSQVRDLLKKMGVTTRDGQPISYQFVFNTVNRPVKTREAKEADAASDTHPGAQARLDDQEERDGGSRQKAGDKPAQDRAEGKRVPSFDTGEKGRGRSGIETATSVEPTASTSGSRLSRRSLIFGGLGAGAAAVYFTRSAWLPLLNPPRTITQSIILSGHTEPVTSGDFDPRGDFAVTASLDGTARIWHMGRGRSEMTLQGHQAGISSVAYSPTARAGDLLTASDDGTARVWSLAPERPFALPPNVIKLGPHAAPARAAWAPDGSRVVTGGRTDALIWDPADGKQLALGRGHDLPITAIAYSAAGVFFATTSEDKTARVWQAGSGALFGVLAGHAAVVVSADFSPTSNKIVTASWDATARVWDLSPAGGPAEQVFQHEKGVTSARFSPDSSRIVTACLDGNAWLWDKSSVAGIALRGHEAGLNSALFSSDGKLILTAASDDTARLWNGMTGEALAVFLGHGNTVRGARFSPDGRRMLTWSDDRTARLWEIPPDLAPDA